MNISNKAMVAVDALVALHQNRQRQATSLVTLSSLLNVSVSYLEFIFKELRTVVSCRLAADPVVATS